MGKQIPVTSVANLILNRIGIVCKSITEFLAQLLQRGNCRFNILRLHSAVSHIFRCRILKPQAQQITQFIALLLDVVNPFKERIHLLI